MTIKISPDTLSDGQVGQPYEASFSLSGGTPPYHLHVIDGRVAPGLKLGDAGPLRGEPQEGGEFHFVLEAVDEAGGRGYAEYTHRISEAVIAHPPEVPAPEPVAEQAPPHARAQDEAGTFLDPSGEELDGYTREQIISVLRFRGSLPQDWEEVETERLRAIAAGVPDGKGEEEPKTETKPKTGGKKKAKAATA